LTEINVPITYEGETFCGKPIIKTLEVPTVTGTATKSATSTEASTETSSIFSDIKAKIIAGGVTIATGGIIAAILLARKYNCLFENLETSDSKETSYSSKDSKTDIYLESEDESSSSFE